MTSTEKTSFNKHSQKQGNTGLNKAKMAAKEYKAAEKRRIFCIKTVHNRRQIFATAWPAPNDERYKCAFLVDVILLPQKTNEKPWFVACDLQPLYKIELCWPQTLWTQKSSKMAMWTCGLCVGFAALLLSQMLAHIRQVHSGDKEFEITCGISNCEKSYKKYDSFYQHVKNRHHAYLDIPATDLHIGEISTICCQMYASVLYC